MNTEKLAIGEDSQIYPRNCDRGSTCPSSSPSLSLEFRLVRELSRRDCRYLPEGKNVGECNAIADAPNVPGQ